MAAPNNVGGEIDFADPRDLADLEDNPPEDKGNNVDLERGNISKDNPPPVPKEDKGELPENDEEEEETPEEVPETNEEDTGEEKETEEETEEDDEIVDENKKPSFKAINEKYPKFFKQFPEVREALGRELGYKEVFPTVQDAKDAGEVIETFNKLQESVMSGSSALLLGTLHNQGEGYVNKFAKNFLPTLQKGNPKLFSAIITPYINKILHNALNNANSAGNNNLKLAVQHLAKFIHGTEDGSIPPDPELDDEDRKDGKISESERSLREENQQLSLTTLRRFAEDVKDSTEKILRKDILKNVDPENALPEFMQDALVNKIIGEIIKSLESDKSHSSSMSRLWLNARKNGYSKEDRSQLISAFLARARKILPSIRDKHKKGVMEKIASISKEKSNRSDNTSRRRIPESGLPSSKGGIPKARDISWKNTSDEDFLDDKYVPARR